MKKLFFVSLLAIMIMAITQSCDSAANKKNVQENNTTISSDSGIVDYGNGVFYFHYIGSKFANKLSDFIKIHPELELQSFSGNGTKFYGRDRGYFVVFKTKNK